MLVFLAEMCTLASIYTIRYLAQYIVKVDADSNEAIILLAIFVFTTFLGAFLRNFYIY